MMVVPNEESVLCALCEKTVNEEGDEDNELEGVVVCDVCDLFFHASCIEENNVDLDGCFDQDSEWLCSECTKHREREIEAEKASRARSSRSGRAIEVPLRFI
jgi:hypothetical protein